MLVIESSQTPTKDPVMKRILKNKNSKIVKRILNKNNKGQFAIPHILKRYYKVTAVKILQYVL